MNTFEGDFDDLPSEPTVLAVPHADDYLNVTTAHTNIAEKIIERHGERLRHVFGVGWFEFVGTHWQPDDARNVWRHVLAEVKSLQAQAHRIPDDEQKGTCAGVVRNAGRANSVAGILEIAGSMPPSRTNVDELDSRSADFLACENGTVDLKSGAFLEGVWSADHMLTRCCPTPFEQGATDERFDRLLAHLIPDPEAREWLQTAVGYSILGKPSEDRIFALIGATNSGKGTLMAAIAAALGDFVTPAKMETFCSSKRATFDPAKARSDLHQLIHTRMVVCDEVEEGHHFNLGLLKSFAGGGTMLCRKNYGDQVRAKVTFALWFVANPGDLPHVSADDDAMWRRLARFHLGGSIPKEERDPRFREEVVKEPQFRRAVLAWAVRGAVRFRLEGLGEMPASVNEATMQLRDEMNTYGPLLEMLEFGAAFNTPKDDIKALAADVLDNEPTDRALLKALRRAAERAVPGLELARSSLRSRPSWRGVAIKGAQS